MQDTGKDYINTDIWYYSEDKFKKILQNEIFARVKNNSLYVFDFLN